MTVPNSESGFVLPLAILLMIGVVVIAVGAMEVTLTHASYGNSRLDRVIATGLAEGGVDLGYQRLADDSTFRGTFSETASTGEVIQVTIADVAGGLQITSTSTYGSVVRGARAHLRPDATRGSAGEFVRPMETQGNLTVSGGKLEVIDGSVLYGGVFATRFGGRTTGDFQATSPGALGIDTSLVFQSDSLLEGSLSFDGGELELELKLGKRGQQGQQGQQNSQNNPDLQSNSHDTMSGTTLSEGSHHSDAMVVDGNLYLTAPTTLTGKWLVDGHLTVVGAGDVALGTDAVPLTLIVTGQVNINSGITSTDMNGLFVCTNRFGLWYTGTLNGRGGLYVDSFEMGAIDASWTFDPSIMVEPNGVTGLPVFSDATTYSEVWREPLVNPK